jgi:RHS repeat-associated protein
MKKVVTKSGDYDGTVVYFYDGQKIIETRDGSGNLYQQFIHGTRYIDELVMVRVADKGDLYVHQDANWNVIGLTDLGGNLVERYKLTPYGQLTVDQETGYGDRDGDGDVDATDKGTPGTDCTGTVSGACRILDLDFDGDYDSTDATKFDNLPQGLARHPGRIATGVEQPFGHQGLLFEPEIGSYQNRRRQYDPGKRRFVQRDPLATRPLSGGGYHDGLSQVGRAPPNGPKLTSR